MTIEDTINSTLYWFECQECDFKTDEYLKQYYHKAKTQHVIAIKSIGLKYLNDMLNA